MSDALLDATSDRLDRLYELLPVVYRQRDVENGNPLRDLLRAIAEQVNVIEDDITAMYDDWFIETCRGWVVPYIAELVGYPALHSLIVPRRDVANYIRDLRRRGTLALLENLGFDTAGFPTRAVEFYTLLGRTQSLNHLDHRGALADLRDGEGLDLIDSPFDRLAHTVDLRGVNASRNPGRYNIPSAGAFAWRLRAFPVTKAPAALIQGRRAFPYASYTFSALGNDSPLFTRAEREPDPTTIAGALNLPAEITRRALELHRDDYYGESKSFAIWLDGASEPVPKEKIKAANLSKWDKYRPEDDEILVDPELGRMLLPKESDVRVSYRYGFSDDVGAHETVRVLTQPRHARLYRVGENEPFTHIAQALKQWSDDKPADAVIEIADNRVYTEPLDAIEIGERTSLQIRAANRFRPVLRVLDYEVPRGERLDVVMHERARFALDGITLVGRPLRISGEGEMPPYVRVAIRRCTFIPGWDLEHDCQPTAPEEASIELDNIRGSMTIDRTITGTIAVVDQTAKAEPVAITLRDSILDATDQDLEAIVGPNAGYAWAAVTIVRCTVIGHVFAHEMTLGENSIFDGQVKIVRRQRGCVRFCYVTTDSSTPRRYHCQPDLVMERADDAHDAAEERRVTPTFTSTRFGDAGYCQLARDCAVEIARGADDESEMGAFHDRFLPQREANLRARLDQSTPAGMETGIIYAD